METKDEKVLKEPFAEIGTTVYAPASCCHCAESSNCGKSILLTTMITGTGGRLANVSISSLVSGREASSRNSIRAAEDKNSRVR